MKAKAAPAPAPLFLNNKIQLFISISRLLILESTLFKSTKMSAPLISNQFLFFSFLLIDYSFQSIISFQMPVSLFKDKIATEVGLPVNQQRLIFRGKVLKDEHLLSHYRILLLTPSLYLFIYLLLQLLNLCIPRFKNMICHLVEFHVS